MDDNLFADFWNIVKEYVPAKDRQSAADHVINVLIDAGATDEILFALRECDKNMADAVNEELGESEDYDDVNEDEDNYGWDD
ncbi:hypothetical protein N9Z41_02100 [bacterium]|jgi:hypothetical protein|nr:hypothetical protein [bacterium]